MYMKYMIFFASVSMGSSASLCYAAGIERSGQSIQPFFESGNYAELFIAQIHPHLSGENSNKEELAQALNVSDFSTGNLVRDSTMLQAALKFQPHAQISAGLIIDQPFGIQVNYDYRPDSILGKEQLEAIDIDLKSNNITGLIGYQPTPNWNLYAGAAVQSFKGDISLFGQNYYFFNGYSVNLKKDHALGWLTGISYQIPEIALRASLTYRSKIKHRMPTEETLPTLSGMQNRSGTTEIETPQSATFDFMSGLNTHTLIFGSLRWVNWQNFKIQPTGFSEIMQPYIPYIPQLADFKLVDYRSDQWSAKLGIAYGLSDQWISSIETAWDSGSGNPSSTVSPADGYYGLGTGIRYSYTPKSFISGGVYYFRFNPSKADNGNINVTSLSTLENRDAWAYGLKVGRYF